MAPTAVTLGLADPRLAALTVLHLAAHVPLMREPPGAGFLDVKLGPMRSSLE
jgi:hypothetical protein